MYVLTLIVNNGLARRYPRFATEAVASLRATHTSADIMVKATKDGLVVDAERLRFGEGKKQIALPVAESKFERIFLMDITTMVIPKNHKAAA